MSGTVSCPSATATCSAAAWYAGHSATRLLLPTPPHASHAAATAAPSPEDDEEAVEGVSGVGLAVGVVSDVGVAEELAIVGAEDGEEERLRRERVCGTRVGRTEREGRTLHDDAWLVGG